MLSKGKSIDGLMRHVRDNHGLSIGGSKEKKELLKTEMLKAARDLSRDLGYYKEELK